MLWPVLLATVIATGCSAVDSARVAKRHIDARRYERGVAAAEQATQRDPNYAPGWYWLGSALYHEGQFHEAIAAFQKALRLNPSPAQLASSYEFLASSYNQLKQYDLAIPIFKRAIELTPDDRISHNNLGVAYMGTRQYDLAVASFRRALQLDPIDKGGITTTNLGEAYYDRGEYALAERLLRRARDRGSSRAAGRLDAIARARAPFGGVGAHVTIRDGVPTVDSTTEASPARHVRILAGDRILKVDGVPTRDLTIADFVRRSRGTPGTKVTLTVARDGWTSPRDVELIREQVRAESSAPTTAAASPEGASRVPPTSAVAAPALSSGSGFLLRNTNLILTNHHVVADRTHITVSFPSGEEYVGRVVVRDRSNDLALVEAEGRPPGGGLVLAPAAKIEVGAPVYALGYPLGRQLSSQPSLVSGEISSTVGLGDDIGRFRTTAPINPGNSGGPIVNQRGQVIGIAVTGLVREGVEAIRFGIKASTARLVVQQAQTTFDIAVEPAEQVTRSAAEIFADLSRYVVLIESQ